METMQLMNIQVLIGIKKPPPMHISNVWIMCKDEGKNSYYIRVTTLLAERVDLSTATWLISTLWHALLTMGTDSG